MAMWALEIFVSRAVSCFFGKATEKALNIVFDIQIMMVLFRSLNLLLLKESINDHKSHHDHYGVGDYYDNLNLGYPLNHQQYQVDEHEEVVQLIITITIPHESLKFPRHIY